jgi:hypothetical protein
MSLLFIMFMDRTKKTGVTAAIHTRLRIKDSCPLPKIDHLVKFTMCVNGRTACAKI